MGAGVVQQADVERWILARSPAAGPIDPAADLVSSGHIDDFSLVELAFVLGELGGRPLDVQAMEPAGFRTLRGLCDRLLAAGAGKGV